MVLTRRLFQKYIVGISLVASSVLLAELAEKDLGAFVRPGEEAAERLVSENAKDAMGKISKIGSFGKWKTFEDGFVKFSYPDHGGITLEVKGEEPVKVQGGRVSSVDTSYSKAYRLVAGGKTLGVLMLQDAEWLDDGICLCGAIAYERYLVRRGNLYRFSFLESGVLKKMQVLGGGKRLMMFEWTHSPIHQAVYREIARSVELIGKGGFDAKECRKTVLDRYGKRDAVGWFDEGAKVEAVEGLLGKPARSGDDGQLVWETVIEEDGYRRTERFLLPFNDGKLGRFDENYFDSGWENRVAIRGGVEWMLEQIDPSIRGDVFAQEKTELTEELKKELLVLFLKNAADPAVDFNDLCRVLNVLVKQGLRDENALKIVRARFAKNGGHYAAWVLREADDVEGVGLFVSKVRQIYAQGKDDPEKSIGLSSDLHNLLAFIPKEDARYPDLLRDGLTSGNESVRESAYFFIGSAPFPAEERMEFVRAGLQDASARVRYWAAGYFRDHEAAEADWEILREISGNEKDQQAAERMREVLKNRK